MPDMNMAGKSLYDITLLAALHVDLGACLQIALDVSAVPGICTECGNKIQPGRLEVVPTATLCIECQRIQEKKVI